jgi:hypothetical protein
MRLSKTFLNWRYFTLKYQLPIEDLDLLISMTIDEDLKNMIEQIHQIRLSLPPWRSLALKYQLPTENLDSLVLKTLYEDLENMIDEYDWTNSSNSSLNPEDLSLSSINSQLQT